MANCSRWPKVDLVELTKKQWGILEHVRIKWNNIPFNNQLFRGDLCNINKTGAMKSLDKQRFENYNVKKLLNGYFCNHIVTARNKF